jgi:hypothetical protein
MNQKRYWLKGILYFLPITLLCLFLFKGAFIGESLEFGEVLIIAVIFTILPAIVGWIYSTRYRFILGIALGLLDVLAVLLLVVGTAMSGSQAAGTEFIQALVLLLIINIYLSIPFFLRNRNK